jgi:hypothetical protein
MKREGLGAQIEKRKSLYRVYVGEIYWEMAKRKTYA